MGPALIHMAWCDLYILIHFQLIFVLAATLWVIPLYLAMTFLGYVINQLVASLGLYFKHLRSDVVYKNDSLARNGYQADVYDRMVKMGGMPKRLDRLIEEVRHVEQVGFTMKKNFNYDGAKLKGLWSCFVL